MDRGIRVNVNHKFVELLPQRAELGNTKFRASVIAYAMEEFGITLASAATHYNHAFKVVRAATPELVADLGRAEDKKGGRKPKAKVVAEAVAVLLSEGVKEDTSTLTVTVNPEPVQTVFTVKKKSTNEVIGEFTLEAATALVAKAKAAKKAALYFI